MFLASCFFEYYCLACQGWMPLDHQETGFSGWVQLLVGFTC